MRLLTSPLLSAAILAAALALPGLANAQAQVQNPQHRHEHRAERAAHVPGKHIEGRIAFLRAELKIKPEQAAAFDRLAETMRAEAAQMQQRHDARQANPPAENEAADIRAERRIQMMKDHLAAQERYLAAFKPLYASLDAEQKKAADELLGRKGGMMGGSKHGGHHGGHHGGMRHH